MPTVQLTKKEIEQQEKAEKEKRDLFYRDKQKDRDNAVLLAKIPTRVSRFDIFFNAPARFIAIILSYKLLKRNIDVPEWMQKFVGR